MAKNKSLMFGLLTQFLSHFEPKRHFSFLSNIRRKKQVGVEGQAASATASAGTTTFSTMTLSILHSAL